MSYLDCQKSFAGISLILAGLLALPVSSAASSSCESALPVGLPAEWRGQGSLADEWFRFETFSPGLVAIAVASPLSEPAEPWLEIFDGRCAPLASAPGSPVLGRTAAEALVELDGGEYFVRVAATDPRVPLGRYRLTLTFAESSGSDPPRFGDGASKLLDPADREPDPDPIAGGRAKLLDPADREPDPDPLVGPRVDKLGGLCRSGEVDDHGDVAACATPLEASRPVVGEIGNDWQDDRDEFVFVLRELSTIAIETAGDTDTVGGLYDRDGQRLAIADGGGAGSNFRMITTLLPGRYYVRVEGALQAEGRYRLSLDVLR